MKNFQIDFVDGSSHGYEYVESYDEILPKIVSKLQGKDKRYWPVNIKIRRYDSEKKTANEIVGFISASQLKILAQFLISLVGIQG